MTSIYSVYHGVNKQQPSSSLTTTTTIHDAHPQCPPIITTSLSLPTTWTCQYTIQMMQKHHVSSWQVDGRWWQQHGTSMDIWWWQRHVQPQVSTHSSSPQSPSWPWNRCHVIYMATRQWMTMLSFGQMTNDNDNWPQPQPQQTTTMPQRWQDDTTQWEDDTKMWWWHDHNNTPPTNGNEGPTPPPRQWHRGPSTTAYQRWWAPNTAPNMNSTNGDKHPTPHPINGDEHPPPTNNRAHNDDHVTTWQQQCNTTMTLCSLL